jgi:tetratricopeptide (TPR) repeat protein
MFGGKSAKILSQALDYFQRREWQSAQELFQQILQTHPQQTDALQCLGMIAAQTGQLTIAIDYFQRAVQAQPQVAGFHYNLGNALQSQGDLSTAIACYLQTLALDPDHLAACYNLGSIYLGQGQPAVAIPRYQRALQIQPDLIAAQANLGNAYLDLGQIDSAIACYQKVLSIDPQHSRALYNLGLAHQAQAQLPSAIACFQAVVNQLPADESAHLHLGMAYLGTGQISAAIATYQQAIAQLPNSVAAHTGLGLALLQHLDLEAAIQEFNQAIDLDPLRVEPHLNRAIARLLGGNFELGWAEYEWRRRQTAAMQPGAGQRHFSQPEWDGTDLQGRTLLIHMEQGFGDAIQFMRYIPLLADRGGKLILECYRPLQRLFASLPGIDQLIIHGDPLPRFDLQAPLLSLPRIWGTTLTTLPASVPYLTPPPPEFPIPFSLYQVGIVWASRGPSPTAQQRSCPLEAMLPLTRLPGVKVFSLQVGLTLPEQQLLAQSPEISNLSPHLQDFADTASAIAALDLIITVDTAVAHLAGALGQKTWLLLPHYPDWRWMLERTDSPWYPSLQLFRQPRPGDWQAVFQQVQTALEQLGQSHQ